MTKQFNFDFQIRHLEEMGVEIKRFLIGNRSKKTIHYRQINPVERLRDKGLITREQEHFVKLYQIDYELANKDNHSAMSYDCILTDGGKCIVQEIDERRLEASKRVDEVKIEVERTERKSMLIDRVRGRKPSRKNYTFILKHMIEQNKCSSAIALLLGYSGRHRDEIENRAKTIAEIIENIYQKSKLKS